jgi:hypothetical protein
LPPLPPRCPTPRTSPSPRRAFLGPACGCGPFRLKRAGRRRPPRMGKFSSRPPSGVSVFLFGRAIAGYVSQAQDLVLHTMQLGTKHSHETYNPKLFVYFGMPENARHGWQFSSCGSWGLKHQHIVWVWGHFCVGADPWFHFAWAPFSKAVSTRLLPWGSSGSWHRAVICLSHRAVA